MLGSSFVSAHTHDHGHGVSYSGLSGVAAGCVGAARCTHLVAPPCSRAGSWQQPPASPPSPDTATAWTTALHRLLYVWLLCRQGLMASNPLRTAQVVHPLTFRICSLILASCSSNFFFFSSLAATSSRYLTSSRSLVCGQHQYSTTWRDEQACGVCGLVEGHHASYTFCSSDSH